MEINKEYLSQLQKIVGVSNYTAEIFDRISYSQSCTHEKAGTPLCVVRPHSTSEVIQLVQLARKYHQKLWVWGRGTLFVGSGVKDGFTIIDTTGMNHLIQTDLDNLAVTVQGGMTWGAVNGELRSTGWELAVQGSGGLVSATVGGTIATNAVPHGLTRGGMTGDIVLNLEVVLPSGKLIHTGSASNPQGRPFFRYGNGADLTGLFIGSCGAFGIITGATLKIKQLSEKEEFFCYGFPDYKSAIDATSMIQQQELSRFIVAIQGDIPTIVDAQTIIHLIDDGRRSEVAERKKLIMQIMENAQGVPLDTIGTRKYWKSQDVMYSWLRWKSKSEYYRWGSTPRSYFCPEVTAILPVPELVEVTDEFWKYWKKIEAERNQYAVFLKGYDIYFARGGGSLWIDILFPSDNPDAVKFGLKVQKELLELVLNHGATVPLIGAGMQANYTMPVLKGTFELLQALKATLDPDGLLNPGVLLLGASEL